MKFLEKYLTRVPMYLLITGSLGVLFVAGLVAPFFDQVNFTPFALLASTGVFVVSGLVSNFLLGKAYSAPSHLPSAVITSLILVFLFSPTLDPSKLLLYAVISVVAQTSKYVVAPRLRHIFNPAAFGAFIGAVALQQYASWWIGAPFFAAFVAASGFLILYKTRQLALGGVFMATSLALLFVRGTTLDVALLSWPLLFFAGFMLSEPLTLPAKKWQKMTVGFVAAVVVCLPFHIGDVFQSSPAFALLLANIVAFVFAFRSRKSLQLTLKERRALTPTTDELVFESPNILTFEPGQYAEFTLMQGSTDARGYRRSFSITNVPGGHELRIGVKFYQPSSSFKKALKTLAVGSRIQTTGIYGDFTAAKDLSTKLLLVAGGIGITPFISFIAANPQRDITLLYFARDTSEFAYRDVLDASGVAVHYFSSNNTPFLTHEVLAKYAPDASERTAYVSGPPLMVTAAKSLLRGRVKKTKTDYFSGY